MDAAFNEKKLAAFLRDLTQEERIWLLREMLSDCWRSQDEAGEDVALSAERWFMDRCRQAASPRQRVGRQKFLAIFLLLRYGGLRPTEISALLEEDISLEKGVISIRGINRRLVPLPLPVAERLLRLAQSGALFLEKFPFVHDASQLRRLLRLCARSLALDRSALTVRSLHRLRALELQKAGIHPQLVNIFFHGCEGIQGAGNYFHNPEALLIRQVQKEIKMDNLLRTSARNIFRGNITCLEKRGLLVHVKLKTRDDLEVLAIVTRSSAENLGLETGMAVNALVKAPWVRLYSLPLQSEPESNVYEAEIENWREEDGAMEIMLKLGQNTRLCALYAGERPDIDLQEAKKVAVAISALAIILVAG